LELALKLLTHLCRVVVGFGILYAFGINKEPPNVMLDEDFIMIFIFLYLSVTYILMRLLRLKGWEVLLIESCVDGAIKGFREKKKKIIELFSSKPAKVKRRSPK